MQEFLSLNYEWFRGLHIIAVMAWMAGLLYLPRLFVYHADSVPGSEKDEVFKIMEKRLMRFIMAPASILALLFGGLLFWANPGLFQEGWMHVKLTAVIIMIVFHHLCMIWRKKLERGENVRSVKFFRLVNEVPTVLMIVIVMMAVVQPF